MTTIDFVFCPACDNATDEPMGALGNLLWFRCPCCGIDFSVRQPS